MVECTTLNYVLEALAALFAGLFVASEVIGWNNTLNCGGVSEVVMCSCVRTVRFVNEHAPNITPRSSFESVRRSIDGMRKSVELPRIDETC
jgi:hypothetical protein